MFPHIHGPDCNCGSLGGVPGGLVHDPSLFPPGIARSQSLIRPLRRAKSGGNGEEEEPPFAVAPPPAFVSPFSQAQETATRHVLNQIHPDVGISRSALTLLMRVQDALAHYLLWRAYRGENPPHRPGRSADGSRTQPQKDHDEKHEEALTPQMNDPSHAIHFLFPPHVWCKQLALHANSERSKAMIKLLNGENYVGQHAADLFQFGMDISARWFADFQTGVEQGPNGEEAKAAAARALNAKEEALEKKRKKNTGNSGTKSKSKKEAASTATGANDAASSSSSAAGGGAGADESKESKSESPATPKSPSLVLLPEVLQQPMEQASLCAIVEYITAELLELAGNRTLDAAQVHMQHANIQPLDIWQSVVTDEELRDVIKFLNVCWKTRGTELLETVYHASMPSADAPKDAWGLPPIQFLLEEEFATSLEHQREVNEGSWYHDAKKVDQFARLFARGVMRLSPVERSLMELQVRPLRFYGRDHTTMLSQPPPMPNEDGDEAPAGGAGDAVSFVSVAITDGQQRDWIFLLEIACGANWRGCVRELVSGNPVGYIQRARVDLAMCALITDEYGAHYTPRVDAMSELESDIVAQITALKKKLDEHRAAKETIKAQAKTQALEGVTPNVERVVEALVESVSLAAERDAAAASGSTSASVTTSAPSLSPSPPLPSASTQEAEEVFDPFAVLVTQPRVPKSSSSASSSSAASASSAPTLPLSGDSPSRFKRMPSKKSGAAGGDGSASSSSSAAATSSGSAHTSTAVAPPPVLSLGSTSRLSSLSGLLGGISSHIVTSQVQSELEVTVSRILHLACWSRYGPTLYTANHPPTAKRAFTVALLDEAMLLSGQTDGSGAAVAGASGEDAELAAASSMQPSSSSSSASSSSQPLPQLPIVLLDLIAQFHSFDLPFLPNVAASQLKNAGWLPVPANRARYPGQSQNPVERTDQATSGLDEILEPLDIEEPMDDEDDEGEDEEYDEDEHDDYD